MFNEGSLIVAEAMAHVESLDKPEKVMYRVDLVSRKYGRRPGHVYLLALIVNKGVTEELSSRAEKYGVKLIYCREVKP